MKTTSKGRKPYNIKSWISQQPQIGFSLNFKITQRGPKQSYNLLEMKTFNGRRPQNINSWISQQPLVGSSSNFKLMLRGPKQS